MARSVVAFITAMFLVASAGGCATQRHRRTAGFVTGGLATIAGGALLYDGTQRDCPRGLGGIDCSVGSLLEATGGGLVLGLGVLVLAVAKFSGGDPAPQPAP